MVRINRVYTKAGDAGQTALIGGDRVGKDSLRVECYGTVDELMAVIGLVRTALEGSAAGPRLLPTMARIQNELFNLGSLLATPDAERRAKAPPIEARHIEALEAEIDELNDVLPELRSFVLPGGGWAASYLHLGRTVCRRAERLMVRLAAAEAIGDTLIPYINRLSDALFVFARWAVLAEGRPEPLWEPGST
ncbi:MAG TPA: cob(I)yrinic acid a,c-diamide adenosyltransferase [Kofleriaceae bacterium]|jgi:cob(I)alamin adenosyltransferase|nr:cob(I)yrinic acid a,c-diamide adenosyltransferase [Kofleriaceae bacterium]